MVAIGWCGVDLTNNDILCKIQAWGKQHNTNNGRLYGGDYFPPILFWLYQTNGWCGVGSPFYHTLHPLLCVPPNRGALAGGGCGIRLTKHDILCKIKVSRGNNTRGTKMETMECQNCGCIGVCPSCGGLPSFQWVYVHPDLDGVRIAEKIGVEEATRIYHSWRGRTLPTVLGGLVLYEPSPKVKSRPCQLILLEV